MAGSSHISRVADESGSVRARRLGFSALLWQGSTLISTLSSIILMLFVARLCGPDWYGDLATYLFISSVGATIGSMGLPYSLTKYVSELGGNDNWHAVVTFSRKQIKRAAVSGILAGAGVFVAMVLLSLTKRNDDMWSLTIVAISIPASILLSMTTQLSIGLQDFRSVFLATTISKLFLVSVGVLVVLLNLPLPVYLSVFTASTAIAAIILFRASRICHPYHDDVPLPKGLESKVKGFCRAYWINSMLDLAVWQQSGLFFLWLLMGSSYSGQFSVAYTLTYVLISMLSGSVALSLFPEFSKLYGRGDTQRGRDTFRVGFKANVLLVAPVASALAIGGASITTFLFGVEYSLAGTAISILAVSSGFVALGGLAVHFGYAHEKHATWMKISIVDSIVAIVLFLVLVPVMGFLGAVVVQAGVQVLGVSAVLYIVSARMKTYIPWRHCCIVTGLAAASFLSTSVTLSYFLEGPSFLLAWGLLGSSVYVLLVVALSLRDSDTSTILRTARTMLKAVTSAL